MKSADRIAVAACALIVVNACETVPPSADQPARTTHTLREEPHRAAVCVARNVDAYPDKLDARIRPGVEPVLIEVHVTAAAAPIALAQFYVEGAGSRAVVEMPRRNEKLLTAMIAGC